MFLVQAFKNQEESLAELKASLEAEQQRLQEVLEEGERFEAEKLQAIADLETSQETTTQLQAQVRLRGLGRLLIRICSKNRTC